MKKIFTTFLVTLLSISICSSTVIFAETYTPISSNKIIVSESTEYFEDGTALKIIVSEEDNLMPCTTHLTKRGSKDYVALNSSGEEIWRFTIYGTFDVRYEEFTTCTESSYSFSISNDAWENTSASASRSSNQAIGNATFIQKFLFVTVDTRDCHVVLTCDALGNLS